MVIEFDTTFICPHCKNKTTVKMNNSKSELHQCENCKRFYKIKTEIEKV